MSHIRLLYFFLFFTIISCVNESTLKNKALMIPIGQSKEVVDSAIVKPTFIYGKSNYSNAKLNVGLVQNSSLFGNEPDNLIKHAENHEDSISVEIPNLKESQILDVHIWDPNYYRTKIFVRPGDSIVFEINNGVLSFSGTKPEHYNFYSEMDSLDNQFALQSYDQNLNRYKGKIDSVYEKRNRFFNQFITSNNVSEKFIHYFKTELELEALYNLLAPRITSSGNSNEFFNSSLDFSKILAQERQINNNDKLFDLGNYFDHPDIKNFKDERLINNDYYKRTLSKIIRDYFVGHEYLAYTDKNFTDELGYIEKELEGEIQNMAKAKLVVDYYLKGFGKDSINSIKLRHTISDVIEHSKNQSYIEEMNQMNENLDILTFNIPSHILDEKLISFNKDTVSLGEILKKNNLNKLMTFWGYKDQCTPCYDGIVRLHELENDSAISENVELLYISIEDDFTIWQEEVKDFGKRIKPSNSYKLLTDNMESKILDYFNVRYQKDITLPRYTIIDRKGDILHNNFVSPADSIAFKAALDKINDLKTINDTNSPPISYIEN